MAAVEQWAIDADNDEPWLRFTGETDAAWEAFLIYRGLGTSRSLTATAVQLGHAPDAYTCKAWSRANGWRYRVEAWDRHVDDVRIQAHLDGVREMERRHVTIAQGALQVLALPVAAMTKDRKLPDGTVIPRQKELEAMPSDELLRLVARTSVSLARLVGVERLTRGEATEILQHAVGGVTSSGRPLPDEERLRLVFAAAEEAGMTLPLLPSALDLPSDELDDDDAAS